MNENRKFKRFNCMVKTKFNYFTGDPETIDINSSKPEKGKGFILDISKGGLYLVTDEKVNISMPIILEFKIKPNNYKIMGKIIRTGSIANNPSPIATNLKPFENIGDHYIAIQFDEPLVSLDVENLKK